MHCGTRAHDTKACKIKVLAVINKIARHKRAHTRVFSTRVCKVDTELYCIIVIAYTNDISNRSTKVLTFIKWNLSS